jgi:hypothetical protein
MDNFVEGLTRTDEIQITSRLLGDRTSAFFQAHHLCVEHAVRPFKPPVEVLLAANGTGQTGIFRKAVT